MTTASLQHAPVKWAKVIDNARCIGCQACTVACKSDHDVPIGVTRTYVKQVEAGIFPHVQRQFQVTRCNQCEEPPCVESCPVSAMFQRPDGIVDFDRSVCIGCKACIAACPYDAIYIDPYSHSAEKCNFCAHRVDRGLEPACVAVCPTQAIIVGNGNDPDSPISAYLAGKRMSVRKPEKGTRPKLYYHDGNQASLSPLASLARPQGFASQTQPGDLGVNGRMGAPGAHGAAAAVIAYDNAHRAPWDWRVSAYTWTKSLGAGVFLVAAAAALCGFPLAPGFAAAVDVLSLLLLAATGALLIGHLSHPGRFWYIFVRPQWRSWLARGAYAMAAFGAVVAVHLLATLVALPALAAAAEWADIPLALLTAVFTGFILGQSKGRDLWQSPLVPLHLAVQCVVAGAAVIAVAGGPAGSPAWTVPVLAVALAAHLTLALLEGLAPHPTADATAAAHQWVWGRFRPWYWAPVLGGAVLPLVLLAGVPPMSALPAAGLALAGLLAYEHGYLQAGQSLPLS